MPFDFGPHNERQIRKEKLTAFADLAASVTLGFAFAVAVTAVVVGLTAPWWLG